WKTIWSLKIPGRSLTLWWRYIHHKSPSRDRMLYRQSHFNSPLCPLCNQAPENDYHLLVEGPAKWQAWQHLMTRQHQSPPSR
ncbi:hypothetical protein DM01DRAFT_249232, partial [Hesseltinella vesiculosa]